jgi:hypothetical protein
MSQERTDNLFASESWTAVYTAFTNISLKAYDFDTIREALLAYTVQTYPNKFNDFVASSEFIAILDLVAYMGHSLAFRLDMNTRENFMDTAERRASILQMAKTLGYNKTRPINAKGFMKISSVTTDEGVLDNEGISLAGKVINWNDSNDIDWYENFISILNSSFTGTTKIQNPSSTLTISDVEHSLYEINEDTTTKSVNYPFSANIKGKSRDFEAVRVILDTKNTKIKEAEPNQNNNFTIVNRNDNLGSASDRTGFFVYAAAGSTNYQDFIYNNKISNRIETINESNISNSDVWVQKIDSTRSYVSSVTSIDNDTRETAIYNSLRTGSGDIVSINSMDDNAVELHYPDGLFGNAAYGNYRVWYRTVDNDNFSVNSNDIINKVITIPYVGTDTKTYRLTVTMTSTIDFGENFSGETYTSVRRIAPRSYYSQDRMVNAQDYNVYPLSLGNNVITKLKSVNTSFAGNSRFYEMDDVLGHHSNLSVTGSDGSLFVEDEVVSIPLSYNKLQGNSDNFIRNELASALKHPSLLNKFLHGNKDNGQVKITQTSTYAVDVADGMKIKTTSAPTSGVFVGDWIELLLTASGKTIWAVVKKVETSTSPANADDTLTLSKFIPEVGRLVSVVRGFRTKFTATEIANIKTSVDSNAEQTFTLKYAVVSVSKPTELEWKLHPVTIPASVPSEVHVVFNYNSGIRDNESQYTAQFTGKKVAFESRDEVKFFYGNTTDVIDNETNLSKRDAIFINYLKESPGTIGTATEDTGKKVTVGQVPIASSTVVTDGGTGATFDAIFKYSGAPTTYDFVEDNDFETAGISSVVYTHHLVSPSGIEYELNRASQITYPISDTWKIIGYTDEYTTVPADTNEYKLSIAVSDLANYSTTPDPISGGTDITTIASSDVFTSLDAVGFLEGYTGNVGDSNNSHSTQTSNELDTLGFKGKKSLSYFNAAASSNNFKWSDVSDATTTTDFTTVYSTAPDEYTFTMSTAASALYNNLDADLYFKQYAYGEFTVSSATALTTSNVLLRDSTGTILSNDHITVTNTSGTNYKIIFWTYAITLGELVDVIIGVDTDITTIADFSVRVSASFGLSVGTNATTTTYAGTSSYVYDDYLTSAGYKDSTKVKLLTSDTNDNPFAMLDITTDETVVMEQYTDNNIKYERASKTVVAASGPTRVPSTVTIYYNTTDTTWYIREAGGWSVLTGHVDQTTVTPALIQINYNSIQYRVVEGITFVKDEFTSFRWDHYADINKRIDPSTSNIVDMYVLSSDYVRKVDEWVADDFLTTSPVAPNNFELAKIMSSIEPKGAIADHIAYIPVQFKYLFGSHASNENQAIFKVIKKLGTGYTDSEIKTVVSTKVNEYFAINNWDFGATFYFSELAAYLHKELGDYISSVIITPKYATNTFTNLLSISCSLNEIFMAVTTSSDVKIITQLAQSELVGK